KSCACQAAKAPAIRANDNAMRRSRAPSRTTITVAKSAMVAARANPIERTRRASKMQDSSRIEPTKSRVFSHVVVEERPDARRGQDLQDVAGGLKQTVSRCMGPIGGNLALLKT